MANIKQRIAYMIVNGSRSTMTKLSIVTIGEKLSKILKKKNVLPIPRKRTTVMVALQMGVKGEYRVWRTTWAILENM